MLEGLPPSTQGYHWPHGITIVTPDRKFLFTCETESDQREWIAAFQKVVDRPMLPQEYAGERGSWKGGVGWGHGGRPLREVWLCVTPWAGRLLLLVRSPGEAEGEGCGGRLSELAAPKVGPFLFLVEAHFKHKP